MISMQNRQLTVHPIPPLFDAHSEVLVLGSFPSVRSRAAGFFYGHPQNRFWRVTSQVFGAPLPQTVPEKKAFLLSHHIALWDVTASCEITGSSDSSIRSVTPNDLSVILNAAPIRCIFVNGGTAARYYEKYQQPHTGIPAVRLPSTSPANAAWTLERLCEAWQVIAGGNAEAGQCR